MGYSDFDWSQLLPGISEPGSSDTQYADFGSRAFKWLDQDPGAAAEAKRKQLLYDQAQAAANFSGIGQNNYNAMTQRGNAALDALQQQAMGQNSVSAEQLRQGLGQLYAQQQSMAAGASPRNAALAARTAAIQSGRIGSGMSGQQALAGLQERNQAWNQYGNMIQGMRGQDVNAALGSRAAAIGAYGSQNSGPGEKSNIEKYGPAIQGGAGAVGALFSDKRLKNNIEDGTDVATTAAKKLSPFSYRYKDQRMGAGDQLGVMAQDLVKAGLANTVYDTPRGKAVDVGKLSGANTAMIAALSKRLERLEGDGK